MNALLDSYEGKAEKFRSLVTTQHSLVRKNKLLLSLSSYISLPLLPPSLLPFPPLLPAPSSILPPFFLPSSSPTRYIFPVLSPRLLLSASLHWCSQSCPVCGCCVSASPSLSLPTLLRRCTTCEERAEQLLFLRVMCRIEWRWVHHARSGERGGARPEGQRGRWFLVTVYLLSSLSPPLPFQDPLESWIGVSDSSFLTEESVQVHPGG